MLESDQAAGWGSGSLVLVPKKGPGPWVLGAYCSTEPVYLDQEMAKWSQYHYDYRGEIGWDKVHLNNIMIPVYKMNDLPKLCRQV